ncbi:hypothetical protein [Aeromonas veronii]|uniref:hypothetical protein n=1 Tax=Aeromonas veronii TaxID=654 RepID=UPI004055909A
MNFKFSRIALAFVASASFCAAAETIVPGSAVVSEADIIVLQDAAVGLTITPEANLTVSAIKQGAVTDIAKFNVSGNNAAVRLLNGHPAGPHCGYIFGTTDNTNKIEVCLKGAVAQDKFDANGSTYFKAAAGEHAIRGGGDNKSPQLTSVGADTYKLAMEVVQYTL